MITEFQGSYRWLSNFWPAPITHKRKKFKSVEYGYQYYKTSNPIVRDRILAARTPGEAKRLGKLYPKPRWDAERVDVMLELLLAKFSQHPDLKAKLLATEDQKLIEGNYWHDTFWGVCNCPRHAGEGDNILGKLLMEVRARLRKKG